MIISITNQKGGVSKTTTTINLGAGLANRGYKVLLVDLDCQCNLTQALHGNLDDGEPEIAHCLLGKRQVESIIIKTGTENLYLAPAGDDMTGIDIPLLNAMARESILKKLLSRVKSQFDFILIDNSPYIGILSVNALVASSHYLIPTIADYLPVRGIDKLRGAIEDVREALNPDLECLGALITQYDIRKTITKQVEELLSEQMGELSFSSKVRINAKFCSAPIDKQTIYQHEQPQGKGCEDYEAVTEELLTKLGMQSQGAVNG